MVKILLILLVGLALSRPNNIAWAIDLPFPNCKTLETRIKDHNPCGITKPNTCSEIRVESDAFRHLSYNNGSLFESFLYSVEEAPSISTHKYQRGLIHNQVSLKTGTLTGTLTSFVKFEDTQTLIDTDFKNCRFSESGQGKSTKHKSALPDSVLYDQIPEWCLNTLSSDTYFFSCGFGDSKNKYIAKDLALLSARTNLNDQIASHLAALGYPECDSLNNRARLRHRLEEFTGTSSSSIIKVTKSKIINLKRLNFETQSIGGHFVHYELFGYPVIPAQEEIRDKLQKQDKVCEAAKSALIELESEINKKKNQ
jgi:hypothetical protein